LILKFKIELFESDLNKTNRKYFAYS